jgi:phosphonate transport system permease protein
MTEIHASPVVTTFEAQWRRRIWRHHGVTFLVIAALSLMIVGATHVAGLTETRVGGDPLGRIAVFLHGMLPDLRNDALLQDRSTPGSLAAWYYDLPRWLAAAGETIQIAILATVFGALGAFAVSTLAARNTMPFLPVRFLARRSLEVLRTVPELIMAIILVAAFGVGPLAGVIAVTLGAIGSLGKLFTEVNENADPKQIEAVKAAGGGWVSQVRFGLIPQIAPNLASYALMRLEANLSVAAALGIVGAGGIGLELERALTVLEYESYFAILIMIVVMVMACDLLSSYVRHRLIGVEKVR